MRHSTSKPVGELHPDPPLIRAGINQPTAPTPITVRVTTHEAASLWRMGERKRQGEIEAHAAKREALLQSRGIIHSGRVRPRRPHGGVSWLAGHNKVLLLPGVTNMQGYVLTGFPIVA